MAASWLLYTYLAFSGFVVVLSTCPVGWIEFDQECFLFGSHKKTWNDAELDCRKHSSYLTTDDNQEKHDFFHKFLNIFHSWRLGHFWLGGADQVIENQWRWLETGTAIGSTTYWDQGQPDGNSSANCMSFYMNADNDLVWRDDRCSGHYNYICEQPATSNTSSPVIG
ncbi:perlucin-like protein [Mizuhopecten yessoensis]|uniref:Neurocan core protein n=1 Tax=Mizuhopecten yessoensis TaxID=6573 RepID=A0A210PX96_MIZYE|nr:perlucin-like protein [Mizuhopecten yessoensis]OWF41111.1 Neurocan core protein [Mizuhopecten yessoensis]